MWPAATILCEAGMEHSSVIERPVVPATGSRDPGVSETGLSRPAKSRLSSTPKQTGENHPCNQCKRKPHQVSALLGLGIQLSNKVRAYCA